MMKIGKRRQEGKWKRLRSILEGIRLGNENHIYEEKGKARKKPSGSLFINHEFENYRIIHKEGEKGRRLRAQWDCLYAAKAVPMNGAPSLDCCKASICGSGKCAASMAGIGPEHFLADTTRPLRPRLSALLALSYPLDK